MNFKSLIIVLALVPTIATAAIPRDTVFGMEPNVGKVYSTDTVKEFMVAANHAHACTVRAYLPFTPEWIATKEKIESTVSYRMGRKITYKLDHKETDVMNVFVRWNEVYQLPNDAHGTPEFNEWAAFTSKHYGKSLFACKLNMNAVIKKMKETDINAMLAKEKADRCTEARGVNADTVKNDGSKSSRMMINLVGWAMEKGACN